MPLRSPQGKVDAECMFSLPTAGLPLHGRGPTVAAEQSRHALEDKLKQATLTPVYHAIGKTLEEALEKAHGQIPPRAGRDYAISRVIDWGMQSGGFIPTRDFYVRVVEDEYSPFMT